jgi:hypothetical protein
LTPPGDRYAEAVRGRLPPGQGEFGLDGLLPLVPPHASLAVEAPFASAETNPHDRAAILMDAVRALLMS